MPSLIAKFLQYVNKSSFSAGVLAVALDEDGDDAAGLLPLPVLLPAEDAAADALDSVFAGALTAAGADAYEEELPCALLVVLFSALRFLRRNKKEPATITAAAVITDITAISTPFLFFGATGAS